MSFPRRHHKRVYSGNALILVVSILVLLVLVATAFITKTQSGRFTAIAQRDAARINDRAHSIGQSISDEIAIALFPRSVLFDGITSVQSANARRVEPFQGALRYGHDSAFPFNFAPYEVNPWTNPPDDTIIDGIPELGPFNPVGGPSFGDTRWLRDTEPQRADLQDMMQQGIFQWNGFTVDGTPETFTHWRHLTNLSRSGNAWRVVRDISNVAGNGLINDLDVPIEQWPINRPQNIAGIDLVVGNATLFPSLDYNADGILTTEDGEEHLRRWDEWFSLEGWADAQINAFELPQNFLDLSDLNADGIHNDIGERPTDAFVPYSSRWYAELMMTDADGDGFTDSLWHLSPQSLGPDVRQIVAFSVTDNSARGNVNVATRFHRKDFYNNDTNIDQHGESTRGLTPADLALVGQNDVSSGNIYPWRVGFMDTFANLPGNSNFSYPANTFFPVYPEKWVVYDQIGPNGDQVNVDWNTNQWKDRDNASLLDELGIEVNFNETNAVFFDLTSGNFLSPTDDITSRYGRLWYWQLAGRDPFRATYGLRPFTIPDEQELRIAEGNNYQFVGSRFERSINDIIDSDGIANVSSNQFLRSDYAHRHEAGELRDQLDNRQLLFDNRRKLTMFSGVRNDLLPPWLRWEDRFWNRNDPTSIGLPTGYLTFDLTEYDLDFVTWGSVFPSKITFEAVQAVSNSGDINDAFDVAMAWREQSRQKIDLREYYSDFTFGNAWWESNADGRLTLAERAPLQILLAMTDSQEQGTGGLDTSASEAHGPLGVYTSPDPDASWNTIDTNYYQQTRLMAAGFASNVLAYRDEDSSWRQHSVLPLHPSGTSTRISTPLSAAIAPPILGNQGFDTNAAPSVPYADVPLEGPSGTDVMLLGLEAQPFLVEAFIAHVHQAKLIDPVGACCLPDIFGGLAGGCVEVSESTCSGLLAGTFFPGDLCDPDGDGDFSDSPCQNQGACCVNGSCLTMSESACTTAFGEYLGDGTPCEATSCDGACCTDSGDCEDMSGFSCAQVGGAFAGNDTTCETTTCVELGSCCMGSGTCMNVISSNACTSLGGTFVSGVKCDDRPCVGACCVDFADCIQVTDGGCDDIGGTFLGTDQPCTGVTCVSSGACCLGSDSCHEVQSIDECITLSGDFLAGALCSDTPCSGSCCLGDGECQDISASSCVDLAGVFVNGGDCSTNPCRAACCFSTGGCANLLQQTCEAFNGTFIGDGLFCDASPCVEGACCLSFDDIGVGGSDDGCIEVTRSGCDILGGEYQGDSVSCGSIPCGITSERGACCLPSGLCQDVVSEEVCLALGGVYRGEGPSGEDVSCAENPCVPADACCLDDATCIDVIEELCDDLGGLYQDGSTCADTPCVAACCVAELCFDVTAAECTSVGGVINDQRLCDSSPCVEDGACCISTASCDITNQDDCENVLGGVFQGGGTICDDTCSLGNKGACCMSPLGCMVVVQGACDLAGGSWSAGACDTNACDTGSCCLEDGDAGHCLQVLDSAACDLLSGVFHAGESCASKSCLGACCIWGGDCVLLSKDSCDNLFDPDADGTWDQEDPPGFFNGVGSTCETDTCIPLGSCCLESDTCIDTMGNTNFTDYCTLVLGGIYRPGEFCADSECGGSCCLPDGTCKDISAAACITYAGTYQGTGVFCDSDPCGAIGVCCFASGSCYEIFEDACTNLLGGDYQGDGTTCDTFTCPSYFLVDDNPGDDGVYDTGDESCPQETVAVVQLANPFDRAINLTSYAVEFFGQEFKFEDIDLDGDGVPDDIILPPATPSNPATLILYSITDDSDILDRDVDDPLRFRDDWFDFLDIEASDHPIDTNASDDNPVTLEGYVGSVIIDVNALAPTWSLDRNYYDNLNVDEQNSIALYKFDEEPGSIVLRTQRVLIDRLDPPGSTNSFEERVVFDLEEEWNKVGTGGYVTLKDSDGNRILADDTQSALYVQWDRATRAWGADVPVNGGWHNGVIDQWEHNPRYIFAGRDFIRSEESMRVTNAAGAMAGNTGLIADIEFSSAFHWTEFVTPDDFDGDGNADNASSTDDDLLTDDPDAWFMVEVWSPRAGEFRPSETTEGAVKGDLRFRKPTYFDMNSAEDPALLDTDPATRWSYPDKGWYGQRNDEDDDDTSSDTPAFADDVNLDDVISFNDDEVDMAMAFPLQMLQKDEDFEQVGELLNVWLFGHMVEGEYYPTDTSSFDYILTLPQSTLIGGTAIDAGTITTFSEFMYPRWDSVEDWWAPWVATIENNKVVLDARVNRLRFLPDGDEKLPLMMDGRSQIVNSVVNATNHAWPRLSIAARILDSFVCDGPGRPDYIAGDNVGDDLFDTGFDYALPSAHSYYNANGFTGKATPGFININTAPVEVLRMLPHMYKVVHPVYDSTYVTDTGQTLGQIDSNPRTLIPESIVQWREGANGFPDLLYGTGYTGGPDYSVRSDTLNMEFGEGPKETRGFSSPAEIGVLRPSEGTVSIIDDVLEPWHINTRHQAIRDVDSWRIDFAAAEPFASHDSTGTVDFIGDGVGSPISTDVNFRNYYGEDTLIGDGISGDAEEINLLQSGMSNLISTTSDMFTVHLRVRTFRRNPITGVWNATDTDFIIDDSRYVMLVDRSNVNTPADKPRILYFEKLPN